MARWSIGSYNRFIQESRAEYGLSTEQAREHYRQFRELKGAPVFASDIENRSREADQSAREARIEAEPETLAGLDEYLESYDEADEFYDEEIETSPDYAA